MDRRRPGLGAALAFLVPAPWRTRREIDRWLAGHRARLLRLAWSWCGDPVLAEDLVQSAYDRAVRATGSLRDVDRAEAWIVRIMHRVYLDHLKSAVRREQLFDPADERGVLGGLPAPDHGSPERAASDDERRRLVREAVASLPLGQRQVLTLVDLEEMSYADCAAAPEIPVGTVMSRLNRARATLKERLGRLFDPPGTVARLRRVR
ncbi:MAG: RNA polymerase sigma factor [Gammaproteobacteria bacterium]|nr:RNA polymerase sigma factor [Gammaproteobacteria bacterium]